MSSSVSRQASPFVRRKPPHRIIIARGKDVRTFTIRPWVAGTAAVVTGLVGLLYLAATGYIAFHDDLLAASIARQTRMQQAYEDRIATLRADIDRLTSRQLLNQQQVEADVDRLLGRQAQLDARQDIIAGLSQAARRVGIVPKPEDDTGETNAKADAAAPDAPPSDKSAAADIPAANGASTVLADASLRGDTSGAGPTVDIDAVAKSIDSLARAQVAYVDSVAGDVADRTQKLAAVLDRLGQKVPPSHIGEAGDSEGGVGGPYVAPDEDADPASFRADIALITGELERFGTLRRMASKLPLTKPIPHAPITSRFGVRLDPFLGKPAMHTGVDFRAPRGYPARVTAGGTVVSAGYNGGYGNMVEIDHGNGITTRYGHLSKILVKPGQVVSKGTIIGRAGSTGRSTGPHLHYEVRIDGSAIDPMRYIRAGSEIASLL
jgi:murein DD-endopeptidase MepM/ murein hydrolase activator NlpD